MDTQKGHFEPITIKKYEAQLLQPQPLVFKTGEILEIRGSRFRVEKIDRKKLILKLLPALNEKTNGRQKEIS
jgi:hypothetical protein